MSKMLTAGMIGFLAGMKCKECGKSMCMNRVKKQLMKKMGF